ncbi:MAG TPA: nucleotidyltransferase family protein [Micromonosporaceae bacterium]|nr:nucleotidyltransferase family protein [Micromonosporaceae bacterium]
MRTVEHEILRWAAGAPVSLPGDIRFDRELLLRAVSYNHLATRFHRRLSTGCPPWADEDLRLAARELGTQAVARSRSHLRAAAGLTALLARHEIAVAVLKGVTAYAHLRDETALTWSGDVDIVTTAPYDALVRLAAAGFAVDHKDPPQPYGRAVRHEAAKLRRGWLEVDLHRHFPAWGCPYDELATDPAAHPGAWLCPGEARPGRLDAETLLRESEFVAGDGLGKVRLVRREMAVVVSACHVYASYLTEMTRKYATVRLGELANISAQLTHPGFGWSRFRALVDRHRAHDAVSLTLAMLRRCLDIDLSARWPATAMRYPRDLWFARGSGGFLVVLGDAEDFDDLFLRHSRLDGIVDHLGANVLPVASGAPPVASDPFSVASGAAGAGIGPQAPGRVLASATGRGRLPVRVAAHERGGGHLRMEVRIPAQPAECQIDVSVNLRERVLELVRHPQAETFLYDRACERRTFSYPYESRLVGDEHVFAVTLPREQLAPGPRGTVAALLGARVWAAGGAVVTASTLVPVHLVLAPVQAVAA